jgi:hypothetical protein
MKAAKFLAIGMLLWRRMPFRHRNRRQSLRAVPPVER